MAETGSPFDDIRATLARIPGENTSARAAAELRETSLVKPRGALGRLEETAHWVAAWQGRNPPRILKPSLVIFAGVHGVAVHGVTADTPDMAPRLIKLLQDGQGAVNQIALSVGAGLKVFDLGIDMPTPDITVGPAMTERECAATIAFGMEALADEPDCLALGEISVGGGTAAAAVACGLFGGDAQYWVRAGTGVPKEMMALRVEAVTKALATHRGHLDDPLEVLRRLGGRELAAMVGAIIAARHQNVPVVLDGFATSVAAAVIHALDPAGTDHCIAAHVSAEPAHAAVLDRIGKRPLLDLELRLGQGIGAALGISLMVAACEAHANMATRSAAGWDQ
jgi:nicotinate-nucleotide--dimethylbenzimidazole phosphoribosyltransferase